MRKLKRWLSTLLVCCMVAGIISPAAMASTEIITDEPVATVESSDTRPDSADESDLGEQAEDYTVATYATTNTYVPYDGATYALTYSENSDGSLAIIGYSGEASGNLVLPEIIDGKKVTSIGDLAFYNSTEFTGGLVIPDTVIEIGYGVFSGCTGFSGDLVIPNNVISIGNNAFNNCSGFDGTLTLGSNLETIEGDRFVGSGAFYNCNFTGPLIIPESLINIGGGAFFECNNFSGNLLIPNNVETIGPSAFANCVGFEKLTIGENVLTIGDKAFYDCTGFYGDLIVPNSTITIGDESFKGCSGFDGNLSLGQGISSIGDGAFSDCSGLNGNLYLPDSLETIGRKAFSGCSGFTGDLVIPNNVVSLGYGAFGGCSGFDGELTLGYNLKEIGEVWDGAIISGVFEDCSGLTGDLIIPDCVEIIGQNAFSGCSGFNGKLVLSDNLKEIGKGAFTGCSGLTGKLIIPETITIIRSETFKGCSGFNGNLEIPNVETIDYNAFCGCSGFTGDLIVPDSVTQLGKGAFSDCSGFDGSLIISDEITGIYEFTFANCSALSGNLKIPQNVTNIGIGAFKNCHGFTGDLIVPDSVTQLGQSAFSDCSGFTGNLSISSNITEIVSHTFDGCRKLTGVTIPDSVTSIGSNAFGDCTSLTSVAIPNGVTDIGASAFYGCTNLTSVVMPNSVTSIGIYAFYGCTSLTSVTIPNSVTSISGSTFENCTSLTSVIILDGVTNIGARAFYGCTSLTSVTVPGSVTSISTRAFEDCTDLTSITIPNSVTGIDELAFFGCNNLEDVYYAGSEADWAEISIGNGNDPLINATIHYYSTGPDDVPFEGDVAFLSGYDDTTRQVTFGYSELISLYTYTVADDVDMSNISELLDRYVLVSMEPTREGDDIAPIFNYTITDIQPVESAIGTVSATGEHSLTIDGTEYPVREDYLLGTYDGQEILYHTYNGTIMDFATLEEKTGTLEAWDSTTGQATIDGTVYPTNYLSDLSFQDNIDEYFSNDVCFVTCGSSDYCPLIRITGIYYPGGDPDEFNAEIYHATWLSKHGNDADILENDTPSQILIDNINEHNGDLAIDLWRSFELVFDTLDDVTTLGDFAVEPRDVYSALILDALEASVSYDVVASEFEDSLKTFRECLSAFSTFVKTDKGIDLNNGTTFQNIATSMPGVDVDAYTEKFIGDWYKENYPNISDISKSMKYISNGLKVVGTLEDFAEYCAACETLINISDSMKNVLERACLKSAEVYGPLGNMTQAFNDTLQMITRGTDEMFAQIEKEAVSVVGKAGMKYLVSDVLWSNVTAQIQAACPEVAILQLGYKAGKTISNWLCNTDDAVEKYLKMDYITDIESMIDSIYWNLEFDFDNGSTLELAQAYLSAMELSFRLRDVDCDTAYSYVDNIQSSALGSLNELLGGNDYEGLKKAIKNLQSQYAIHYIGAERDWYIGLYEDYPGSGLYELYDALYTAIGDSDNFKLVKEITAACPVDVYVYDQSDNVVAYVSDGRVSCSVDDLMIALVGDIKVIRLYDEADYRIAYVGNDTGTMDVTIEEYDETEATVRTVNYYDVALTEGQTYSLDADDETMNPYEMEDSTNGSTVDYDYDSMDTSAAHTVTVVSGTMIQDGEIYAETTAKKGEMIEINAYVPDGYAFVRWEVTSENAVIADTSAVNTSMIMSDEDVTVTAIMKELQPSVDPVDSYTITLNANGGVVSVTTMTTGTDGKLSSLSTPTRTGYTFDGWYTAASGGTKVTTSTVFNADTTVYAHWTFVGNDSPSSPPSAPSNGSASYSVSVPSNVENGTVTATPKSASEGDIVTITVTPDEGYELEELTVTARNGRELKLTDKGNGRYTFTMPASKVTIFASFAAIVQENEPKPAEWSNLYTDVPEGIWYYDAVKYVTEHGLMGGTNDGTTFSPTMTTTRGMIMTILARMNGVNTEGGAVWYEKGMEWAVANGVSDGTNPEKDITRQELVTMLWRYAGEPSGTRDLSGYPDAAETDTWAVDAMKWAAEHGVITHTGEGLLNPTGPATRMEVATILMRFCENFVK